MMLIHVSSDGQNLFATQIVELGENASGGGTHSERFTLGLDTLAANDPPAWLDVVAYGTAIAIAVPLLRAVVRSPNRLGIAPAHGGAR